MKPARLACVVILLALGAACTEIERSGDAGSAVADAGPVTAPDTGAGGGPSCTPSCEGRQCGDDGCGGSCGVCPTGSPCVAGRCGCAPDCGSRTCGDDGCGGSCGSCATGEHCTTAGDCECEEITCHADSDGDGFVSEPDVVVACTCPEGYTTRGTAAFDCDDTHPGVHPGADFSADPTCTRMGSGGITMSCSHGGYDWNCDGVEERRWSEAGGCGSLSTGGCFISYGWSGAVPSCGTLSYWVTGCSSECSALTTQRVQECR